MGNNVYGLKVPDGIAALLRNLHPLIKSQIKAGLKTIVEDPSSGKALRDNLQGLRSYRVKKYRIIYRVVPEKQYLEIIAVGPRRNIYEQTFKLLSREKKKS